MQSWPTIAEVLAPGGLISRAHPRWESRPGQLEMAEAVAERLRQGGALAIEAPTGIGKTLAYLVAAALSGRRVILSTHTKTLQDQIAGKDLPLLARALAEAGIELGRASSEPRPPEGDRREIRFALMKGRSNYLCLERLDRRLAQRALAFASERGIERIKDWSEQTLRGDRAELSDLAEDSPEWSDLDARAETCLGTKCPRWDQCFVVRMRREAQQAELIVVNHHLLLADLALKAEAALTAEGRTFGEVIPSADALVIDEAHALEETASEYFGGEISSRKWLRWIKDADGWCAREPSAARPILAAIDRTDAAVQAAFSAIPTSESRVRIFAPRPGEKDPLPELRQAASRAEISLESLCALLEAQPLDPIADTLARRARALAEALRFVTRAEDPDYVYWAEKSGRSARLGAAPIEVGDLLGRFLFGTYRAVVLTSATLTTDARAAGDPQDGGEVRSGFEYFMGRIGAPPDTEKRCLKTPFDYRRQAALLVPRDLPLPDDPAHARALAELGLTLIELVGGGAFFLFTSHRMMREVGARLRPKLRFPTLIQGEAPKQALIQSFIDRAPSVLFATASFWEGVDVPGDPLRLVVIDRLPFASPNDPVVAARLERFEARGEGAFSGYQIPQAILRLKQGFGRLVRSRDDRGVVAILDSRLHKKSYGRRFLAALPDAARFERIDQLASWLARGRSDEGQVD